MFAKLIDASLRYRVLVLIATAVLVVVGVRARLLLPVDAFPDVTPVQVSVATEAPGLAPEDVERLLTFPIEASMAGLPGVQTVRSLSLFGLSSVTVFFADGTDIQLARRLVAERLQEAKSRLPEGYGEPELGPNASGLGQVYWYTIDSGNRKFSDMELRDLQDWTIRMHLRTAPGVDEVISWGGQERQFQVLVDPTQLLKYGLNLRSVLEALAANNRQVGGQAIDIGREQYLVRGLGRVERASDLETIPLGAHEGTPIFLRDVAQIREAGGPRFGAVTRDGREVVMGMALQRIGENATQVVHAVKERVAAAQALLPDGVKIVPVYDRSTLVELAVRTANRALLEGAVLVALVLLLFLGELRSALVVVCTLPLALLIAFVLMRQAGLSANLMSLAGLAVAIGMMIDGAIVVVENAYRVLGSTPDGDRLQKVGEAAREVARPVAFAILIILVVFLPLFSLGDIEGKLFKPMAISISFAMLGALVLTLTVVPVLAYLLLRPGGAHDSWLVRHARRLYEPVLDAALAHRRRTFVAAGVLLAASAALVPLIGREFMPTLQEGSFLFRLTGIPSASLNEMIRVSQEAERVVRGFPQTQVSLATIGRAERGEPEDVNRVEMLVTLKDRADWPQDLAYSEISEQMREALEKALPTVLVSSSQPIQSRVEELVSGVRAPLALRLSGPDLARLGQLSEAAKAVLERIPGAAEVSLEANQGKPQITVTVDRSEAARFGLTVDDMLELVQTGIGGKTAGVVLDGAKRFEIRVWLQPQFRGDVQAIANLPLRGKDGAQVPLSRVAKIAVSEGYAFVRHDDLQRNAVVQLDVRGRDVNGFVRDAQAALAREVKLPEGYAWQWTGSFENQQRALSRLALIVPLAIGLIFVLLYLALGSVPLAGLVLANVPFAMAGGIWSLLASGQYLSVPSAIGFIAVFGVAMLNGVVLVTVAKDELASGKAPRDAVKNAASLRLRPVLMTASVTILGLVPTLLSHGVGAETQRPLATVVVGGLLTSTLLTLVLLPVLVEWYAQRTTRPIPERAA